MGALKAFLFISLFYLAVGDDKYVPIGPEGNTTSTAVPPTLPTTPTTTTQKPTTTTTTTTTTQKPTTTSTTTTQKPTTTTTTTTTQKPTTTTTTTTQKPTTTTASPNTTTTAKPITSSPAPVDPVGKWFLNYTDSDKTCLILEAELSIDVNYKVGNATKNVTITIPPTATVQGQCGDKVENITLTSAVPNSIPNAVRFSLKKSSDGKRYDLETVILMFNMSLPGVNGTKIFTLQHDKDEFSTPVSNSYKCAKEQTLKLTAADLVKDYDGLLRVSHFQMQAFRNSSSTKFDEALDCASAETPDVVPIAVGCALAALIIIVLIAYLIGRRRSQARGYLSM